MIVPSIDDLREKYPDMQLAAIVAWRNQLADCVPASEGAILERANSYANRAIGTLNLQRDRIGALDLSESDFPFRVIADLEFFILTLWHLRQAALLACKVSSVQAVIGEEIIAFDIVVPGLRMMRNVIEHVDEYAVDAGRRTDIGRRKLQVSSWDGTVFRWLGAELNTQTALDAARNLYLAIHGAMSEYATSRTQDDEGR